MQTKRMFKLGMTVLLVMGMIASGLLMIDHPGGVLAQDTTHNTYMVQAGAFGEANVEVLAFAPTLLQVHRGDTVMWHVTSLQNMHFGEQDEPSFVIEEIGGQPTLVGNPNVFFATLENGSAYTGGEVTGSFPSFDALKSTFSVVMDVEPGFYSYHCDIHPGMAGVIEVVPDDQVIPSPMEVEAMTDKELDDQINPAIGAYFAAVATAPSEAVDGVLTVATGIGGTGGASSLSFVSPLAIIQAGEAITWTVPADSRTPHFVNSVPFDAAALPSIIPQENAEGPPTLLAGPAILGTTADGATVAAGESFNSPMLGAGDTFTLTFKDPGVYSYVCHVHPGMSGVVLVQ
jgi:plastocyanin